MFGDRRRHEEEKLAAIRAKAIANSQAVKDDTQPGYSWVEVYPGQVIGRDLTCDACGAVVTIQTQQKHADWHRSGGSGS